MKEVEVAEQVFKFLRTSGLRNKDYYDTEKRQTNYLVKRMRECPMYDSLPEEERKAFEKYAARTIHQYVVDEKAEAFSYYDLYQYLLKWFYGKK